jgi:hypothetical protein
MTGDQTTTQLQPPFNSTQISIPRSRMEPETPEIQIHAIKEFSILAYDAMWTGIHTPTQTFQTDHPAGGSNKLLQIVGTQNQSTWHHIPYNRHNVSLHNVLLKQGSVSAGDRSLDTLTLSVPS